MERIYWLDWNLNRDVNSTDMSLQDAKEFLSSDTAVPVLLPSALIVLGKIEKSCVIPQLHFGAFRFQLLLAIDMVELQF